MCLIATFKKYMNLKFFLLFLFFVSLFIASVLFFNFLLFLLFFPSRTVLGVIVFEYSSLRVFIHFNFSYTIVNAFIINFFVPLNLLLFSLYVLNYYYSFLKIFVILSSFFAILYFMLAKSVIISSSF